MLSLAHLRTFFTALFIALVIVACGGSSGDDVSALSDSLLSTMPLSQEILGSDIDSDGIRDDVQMMIESEHSGDIEMLRRFKSMAAEDQKALAAAHDQSAIDAMYIQHLTEKLCWVQAFSSYSQADKAMDDYRSELYDTSERIAAARLVEQRLTLANKGYFLPTSLDCQ